SCAFASYRNPALKRKKRTHNHRETSPTSCSRNQGDADGTRESPSNRGSSDQLRAPSRGECSLNPCGCAAREVVGAQRNPQCSFADRASLPGAGSGVQPGNPSPYSERIASQFA